MTVDRISTAQFIEKLRQAILDRTRRFDTGYGPLLDTVIRPTATVLEDQNNNRLRIVSLLLSLQNETEFSEDDLDATVFNEGLLRPEGSQATTTLTFRRGTPFTSSEQGRIQRGYPVATSADEESGSAITFITTEERDKTTVVSSIDPDTNQIVYEVDAPAIALIVGSTGKVGPDRINRPLRPLVGYDSVTNKEAAQEGRDRFTNSELIELYLLAVASRQLSVPEGAEFYVRDNFLAVQDAREVFGTDPLLTRAGDDAGAVDMFIVGSNASSQTDTFDFISYGQLMELTIPPVISVTQVTRQSDSEVFVEDEDYEVVFDDSGVSGSTRGIDGIRFLPTATATPALAAGDVIDVMYTYNQLIRDLQADSEDREVQVNGRDLLFRQGEQVDIFLSAQLKATTGFDPADVQDIIETALIDYINGLGLGDDVEESDLQGVVRRFTSVDNFIVTRLVRVSTETGAEDLTIENNEYPRIDAADLSITLI